MEEQMGTAQVVADASKGKKLSPQMEKQLVSYRTILSKLIHSKETRKQTVGMLSSAPPEISVPQSALAINAQAERLMESKGMKVQPAVKLAGAVFLISDLVEIGNATAKWENPVDDEEMKMIFQDTLQDYIQDGLKKGTIDPIELQQSTEPLLNEEQRAEGMSIAQREGIPMEVTQQQAVSVAQRSARRK